MTASLLHELAPLLLALGRAGVELAPHPTDAGRLRHRPADLPTDLREALRRHRGAALGLLESGYAPADPDARYVLAERLGVADGLGLSTHPGAAAWLAAVGESMIAGHAGTSGAPAPTPQTWADVLADALGVPVRVAGILPPGARFAGEPDWTPAVPSWTAARRDRTELVAA